MTSRALRRAALVGLACWLSRLFSLPSHFCTWQIITTCASTSSIFYLTEETTYKSRESIVTDPIRIYQRNDNEMFSLVPQKVMAQPP